MSFDNYYNINISLNLETPQFDKGVSTADEDHVNDPNLQITTAAKWTLRRDYSVKANKEKQ